MTALEPTQRVERGARALELKRLRRSEQLLREQNEELREDQCLLEDARDAYAELYDGAPLPLLTLSPQGTVRSANLASAELFERERSWLVGRSFRMRFRELDRGTVTAFVSAGGTTHDCDAQLVLPDQALVPARLFRRASARKSGVLHVALVDLRASPLGVAPAVGWCPRIPSTQP